MNDYQTRTCISAKKAHHFIVMRKIRMIKQKIILQGCENHDNPNPNQADKMENHTRLQITMEIPTLMHVSKSVKYLKGPVPYFSLRKRLFTIFHELI